MPDINIIEYFRCYYRWIYVFEIKHPSYLWFVFELANGAVSLDGSFLIDSADLLDNPPCPKPKNIIVKFRDALL